ncbi:MAG: hypothetical protein SGBAC_013217 [Bacillariaceae sp.]
MIGRGEMESFELEALAAPAQDTNAGLRFMDDRTTRRNSWHYHLRSLLRACIIPISLPCMLVIATIVVVSIIAIASTRSVSNEEEVPAKTSFGPPELLGDAEKATTAFLIGDIRSPSTCAWHLARKDVGLMPYGEEIDRTVCETHQDEDSEDPDFWWKGSLTHSETLRCYNVTYRWCFVNNMPEGFEIEEGLFNSEEYLSCIFQFFDHNGILYSTSGQRMPEIFNSRCSDKLEWYLWQTTNPIAGCGKEYLYRFCDTEGNIDWDMFMGDGPFNCREYDAISVFRMASADESGMEERCEEQAKGCADRIQRACKDGKYNSDLVREMDPNEECTNLVEDFTETNRVWRSENNEELDLICLG